MAPHIESDWSDSDDDAADDLETSVLLGVPDGTIAAHSDLADAAVSRIGGHPAFLTPEPLLASSQCRVCSYPMQLLVQIWCPFEGSPMDRALYVWGCARGACQRKDGSVRAWRALRFNQAYAAKLARKAAVEKRPSGDDEGGAAPPPGARSNPFKMGAAGAELNPSGGLGSQVFGGLPVDIGASGSEVADQPLERTAGAAEAADDDDLITALATVALADSAWAAAPSYAPLFLSTVAEALPAPTKTRLPAGVHVEDPTDLPDGKGGGWGLEGYENSLDLDHVFERFAKRVAFEGEQCVRYDLGGTPLPFASDQVFNTLFPVPAPTATVVTKGAFLSQPAPRRTYAPASLAPCPQCGGKRIFECQLTPNLINVVKPEVSEDARPAEKTKTDAALGDPKNKDREGMEWGTCMIFSCEKDCGAGATRGCWAEELVLVQWDE